MLSYIFNSANLYLLFIAGDYIYLYVPLYLFFELWVKCKMFIYIVCSCNVKVYKVKHIESTLTVSHPATTSQTGVGSICNGNIICIHFI